MIPLEIVNQTCTAPNPTVNSTLEQARALQLYLTLLGGMTVGNIALNPTVSGPVVADYILPSEIEPAPPDNVKYFLQLKYATQNTDPAQSEGYHCVNAVLNMIRNYGVINGTNMIYMECKLTCPAGKDEILDAYGESGLSEVI